MIEFKNQDDFFWYKRRMELDHKNLYNHIGEPEKYPCRLLKSEYEPCDNDQDRVYYTFIYRQEVSCKECGHKQMIWPVILPETNE